VQHENLTRHRRQGQKEESVAVVQGARLSPANAVLSFSFLSKPIADYRARSSAPQSSIYQRFRKGI